MAITIQHKRDTAANWTSNNPTLAAGEFGFETDTNASDVGDLLYSACQQTSANIQN